MNLNWGENIFCNLYPLIKDLYTEQSVVKKPSEDVIELQSSVGFEVEQQLKKRFVPCFFTQNLCEKTSLLGRISAGLFGICRTLNLHRFVHFNLNSKLFSVVIEAERCWLANLLDRYKIKLTPQNDLENKFIAQHLARVVTQKDEVISNEEIQQRLNKLVALTNVFYKVHGQGHNYVTGRVPQTYFRLIFRNI